MSPSVPEQRVLTEVEDVVARAAPDPVRTGEGVHQVVARVRADPVSSRRTAQHVVAGRAGDDVAVGRGRHAQHGQDGGGDEDGTAEPGHRGLLEKRRLLPR